MKLHNRATGGQERFQGLTRFEEDGRPKPEGFPYQYEPFHKERLQHMLENKKEFEKDPPF